MAQSQKPKGKPALSVEPGGVWPQQPVRTFAGRFEWRIETHETARMERQLIVLSADGWEVFQLLSNAVPGYLTVVCRRPDGH